jgi:PAS domain S-box-containing protein
MELQADVSRDLREKLRLQETALQQAHIIIRDLEDRILFWSAADAEIYGWSAEEALGRPCGELLRIELPEPRENLEHRARTEGRWEGEVIHHCRNGNPLGVLATWAPHYQEDGSVGAYVEVLCNITSQKAAEKSRHEALVEIARATNELERRVAERTAALSQANAQLDRVNATFKTLIDASPAAIIALDREQRIEIWNPEAQRLFGLAPEETRERRLFDLPLDWTPQEALEALLHRPAGRQASLRVHAGDRTLEVSMWSAPYAGDGRVRGGHVLVALDETEKKFLEQAFLEAGEREQRRLGEELHDHLCQQLLGAAFGAQALFKELDRAASPSAERAEHLAQLINTSVVQARNMARGINPVEIDSAGLMSALQELALRAPGGVHIELRCEPPVLVHSAEVALHVFRIAQEAVLNALRDARATRILIRLDAQQDEVTLQISDNGESCPESSDARIGIGIMKYRAQAIGGSLSFDSLSGGGTTVTCTFLNQPEQAP